MSIKKFPGAVISDTPVEPAGPFEDDAASGVWTLDQQAHWQAQGLWPVPGNTKLFIEDVFSTYLYQGNTSTQTITNGIDLAGEGGLVWIKCREVVFNNTLFDTERGATKELFSDSTSSESTEATSLTSFNADGFTVGGHSNTNLSPRNYVSWTFRKAPKFFDVVTYTGNGLSYQQIAHNLGSAPGAIIIKETNVSGDWFVYHRGNGSTAYSGLELNNTSNAGDSGSYFYSYHTATHFDAGVVYRTPLESANVSGRTYVAYLFAHDAGGFGDDGLQNVISCGSYTGTGATQDINLGWETQFLLVKKTNSTGDWYLYDVMRGMAVTGNHQRLAANLSDIEYSLTAGPRPIASGFQLDASSNINTSGNTYIYIAIRRPMKTPESGTEVFAPVTYTATSNSEIVTSGFPVDVTLGLQRNGTAYVNTLFDRFRWTYALNTASTSAESNYGTNYAAALDSNTGIIDKNLTSGQSIIQYMFRRAPGFFDVVAYTGNGVNGRDVIHSLNAVPEFVIIKERTSGTYWLGWHKDINDYYLRVNDVDASAAPSTFWNHTTYPVTSTSFPIGTHGFINGNGDTYIAYLFASLPGVSKVGSYTGTGTTQTINCGFSSGARFVLIKRTDSTGDWYVWDSARGIVAGNDPYLLLNSGAAEVTNTDYIDPVASGFEISSSAPAAINASGGTFIFLAIA